MVENKVIEKGWTWFAVGFLVVLIGIALYALIGLTTVGPIIAFIGAGICVLAIWVAGLSVTFGKHRK